MGDVLHALIVVGECAEYSMVKKASLRNLQQYKDMTDEEFEEALQDTSYRITLTRENMDEEIDRRMVDFEEDYDLSDMKINDRIVLRNLIRTIISLEDFEDLFIQLRYTDEELDEKSVRVMDRIANIMTKLRSDISDMQGDLKLTRKIRKDSREESFLQWLENTKEKAKIFYKRKMLYIFCPECKELLSTIWLLYPDEQENSIFLVCNKCDHTFSVDSLSKLYDKGNKNVEGVKIP